MMRGRRSSDDQKALTGRQHRKIRPPREATPDVQVPEPPEYLAGEVKEVWREIAPVLVRHGLLTDLDLPAFEMLCTARADELRLTAQLHVDGDVVPDRKGSVKVHPAVRLRDRARSTFIKLSGRFGMNPDARQKLGVKPPQPPTPEEATLRMILTPNK